MLRRLEGERYVPQMWSDNGWTKAMAPVTRALVCRSSRSRSSCSVRVHRAELCCDSASHLLRRLSGIRPAERQPLGPHEAEEFSSDQNWISSTAKVREITASCQSWTLCDVERVKLHVTLLFLLEGASVSSAHPTADPNETFTEVAYSARKLKRWTHITAYNRIQSITTDPQRLIKLLLLVFFCCCCIWKISMMWNWTLNMNYSFYLLRFSTDAWLSDQAASQPGQGVITGVIKQELSQEDKERQSETQISSSHF